eukprot:3973902-Pyramimonas_sp.AAC.1
MGGKRMRAGVPPRQYRSDTNCIRSCRDPIQTVWDPLETRYSQYGILKRSGADCMGSCRDLIQTVWDPIQIRYTLYGILYRSDTG